MECTDSNSEYSDELQDFDYYNSSENVNDENVDNNENDIDDPEYVKYLCIQTNQVENIFKNEIDELTKALSILPSVAKILLHFNEWNFEQIKSQFFVDSKRFLIQNGLISDNNDNTYSESTINENTINKNNISECSICCFNLIKELVSLDCGHLFCKNCWQNYINVKLDNGVSTKIECMSTKCRLILREDFVANILTNDSLKLKYEKMVFIDFVNSHPYLCYCPNLNCNIIFYCKTTKFHKVTCSTCNINFCFKCRQNYHAPTSCDNMKKWLLKCSDDSETANYICAHTKDCPKCFISIEKNGGCNHMTCSNCSFNFCWICLKDWKTHNVEYYHCSKYNENEQATQNTNDSRRALEKYLHYYARFENHRQSLKMEEEMKIKIRAKIEEKISRCKGTWIDWQYLHSASHLLTKCRYTLQYTYPFAYFIEPSARKELFEYQQAQLEKEIEELSWKVERAETTDRGDLENQMHIAELKRKTLLRDFF